jgi:hypothetical protein
MSTFFTDIIEQGYALTNPTTALPRSTRRLCLPGHDSRTTAYIEKMSDIEQVFRLLTPTRSILVATYLIILATLRVPRRPPPKPAIQPA